MPIQVKFVLVFTFLIYVVHALGYSVRIVGVRTGRIAVAFSVFNIVALISRLSTTFQAPLLGKTVDNAVKSGNTSYLVFSFRMILFSSTAGVIVGMLLIPTFIRIMSKAVISFSFHRSLPKMIMHSFSKSGIEQFKSSLTVPKKANLNKLKNIRRIPKKIILLNVIATAASTVGSLATQLAASSSEASLTAMGMSPIVNGISTMLLFMFIDPYVSIMTDDVIRGECSLADFERCVLYLVIGLVAGTLLSQLLLEPAAYVIKMASLLF